MSKLIVAVLLSLVFVLPACGNSSSSSSAPASSSSQSQAAAPNSGSSQGEALVNTKCSVCHTTDRIKAAHKTPDQWKATVQQMVRNGAQLTPDEQDIVVKYLSDTYK